MNIKRIISALLVGSLCFSCLTACSKDDGKVKIGVIQIVEHPSLNTIRDSFTEQMKELGYVDGKNCVFDYKSANGEQTTANSIVDSFKGNGSDIIVAIATPTALAAANVSDKIPVVFSAVTDPVAAGLVDSLESTGRNITGTSDALEIGKILDMALTMTPDIKKLGFLYNPSEDNSVSCLAKVKEYAQKHGIEVVEGGITTSSEAQQATQSLCSKVDAIFSPNDNTVASAMQTCAEAAINAKIPFYVGADSMVADNGLATVGIKYEDLGKETANMTAKILKGEKKASEIPVKVFNEDLSVFINKQTAEKIGVTIPESLAKGEKTVFVSSQK